MVKETRKLAAILVADIVGYSRLTGTDEEGTLARLRALRGDLIDPTIAAHNGRLVKRTGDGAIVEFRSVVEAVRCAMEVRAGLAEHNAGLPDDQRIEARVGIHLGDVVEEADGDLMGDGVNIAARLQGVCDPDAVCLSEDAYRQVRDKIKEPFIDLGEQNLKNIARPIRAYTLAAPTEGRPTDPSTTVVPRSPDRAEGRAALHPILDNIVIPSILQRSRNRRERRAAVAAAVAAILRNIAAPRGTAGMAPVERPIVGSSGVIPTGRERRRRRFRPVLIAAAVIAILVAQPWRGHELAPPPAAHKLASAPRLSIVVLPFANLSGDADENVFADGLADDLTTDLSHLPGSFVIGRGAASAYKGKTVDEKQLGRELGVRYALEGSVRRVDEKVTVNAQLISTETGADVWAERFEGERNRLGDLQVEFASRIAEGLQKAGLPGR